LKRSKRQKREKQAKILQKKTNEEAEAASGRRRDGAGQRLGGGVYGLVPSKGEVPNLLM